MPPGPHIILIGLRGSGKTTVGAILGARLRRPWVDLDSETVAVLGHGTVASAWNAAGEEGFRKAELVALRGVLERAEQPMVIALGGGTPTARGVVGELRRAGSALSICYLRARADVLVGRLRTADNSARPPLTGPGADIFTEMSTVLAARDLLYTQIADHVIETEGLPPERVAERVIELCSA